MLNRLLIVFGLVWAAFGLGAALGPIEAGMRWPSATGQVVDVDLQHSRPSMAWRRHVIVEVKTAGGTDRVRSINSSDARVGRSVALLLDPTRAGRAYLPDETSFWIVSAGLLGGGLFAALVGWARRRNGGGPVAVRV